MTRLSLIAPISPANLVGPCACRQVRRILAGKRPGRKFARRWREATGQDLIRAWKDLKDWEKADVALLRERRKATRK